MNALALALLLSAAAPAKQGWDPKAKLGEPAPAFSLPDQDGKARRLLDSRGKLVVLEWFDHECVTTRKYYDAGEMQSLQRKWTARGAAWFAIASNAKGEMGHLTPELARKVRAAEKMAAHILLDENGKVGRLYGAKTTPHVFVLDPKGTLIYTGSVDDCYSAELKECRERRVHLDRALEEASAGKPVTTPFTAAFGCAVKYHWNWDKK